MSDKKGHILIVDDDEDILTAGRLLLRRHFSQVITCKQPAQIPDLLAANRFDAVLLDMNFGPGESSGQQGLHWLERILDIEPDLVVVMITAHGSVDTVVEAMKRGATDFVSKPWQNEKVVATLSAATQLHQSRVETDTLKKTNQALVEVTARPGNNIIELIGIEFRGCEMAMGINQHQCAGRNFTHTGLGHSNFCPVGSSAPVS